MWTLTVKLGDMVVHSYTADTWQELDKIFSALMMCEEHSEPGHDWEYVISPKTEKCANPTADWVGA